MLGPEANVVTIVDREGAAEAYAGAFRMLTSARLLCSHWVHQPMLAVLAGQAQYGYMMTALAHSANSNGDTKKLLDHAQALPKEDVRYDTCFAQQILVKPLCSCLISFPLCPDMTVLHATAAWQRTGAWKRGMRRSGMPAHGFSCQAQEQMTTTRCLTQL